MKQFGLIGFPLTHSFSEKYFKDKFRRENFTDKEYKLFPLKSIDQFPDLIKKNHALCGLNITVPYKESIMPYLDELDNQAKIVGAVNCIKIIKQSNRNKLIGFNTDVFGFEESLKPNLKPYHKRAIILGTGGSAKAVVYVLKKLGISFSLVSRNSNTNTILYADLSNSVIQDHLLIINTTPVGMYPDIQNFPQIPYEYLGKQHLLFDLVYNPEKTQFLQKGESQGASIQNGLEMLYAQAEKSMKIWEQ